MCFLVGSCPPPKSRHLSKYTKPNKPKKCDLKKKDLKELKTSIYPKLHEVARNLQAQRSGVSKHSQKLRTALTEQAEVIHNEIYTIIKDMQSEIDDIDAQHLAAIDKQEKN